MISIYSFEIAVEINTVNAELNELLHGRDHGFLLTLPVFEKHCATMLSRYP